MLTPNKRVGDTGIPKMPFCQSCGNELGEQDRFCRECGDEVVGRDVEPETATDTHDEASDHVPRSESALDFALSYPFENGVGDVLRGGVALLLFFLVIPLLVFLGYLCRLGRAAALAKDDRPTFDDWGSLAIDGLLFGLIYAIFYVGAFFVWLVPAIGILEVTSNRTLTGIYGLLFWGSVWYLIPAVLTVYVATGSMREAYTPARISEFAFTGTYLKAWLVYLVLAVGLSMLISIAAFTIVGLFFTVALAGMVIASYWGRVYYRSTSSGGEPAV